MPAESTYDPIATATSTGSLFQPSFQSIPQTYTDLVLVTYCRSAQAVTSSSMFLLPNNDTSTNKSCTTLYGNGSSAISSRFTGSPFQFSGFVPGASATSGIFASSITHIPNYSSTTILKSMLTRTATDLNGSGFTSLNVVVWPSTSAITRLDVINDGYNNWANGSVFTLYGIRAA
jgi:hypothetical protein